MACVITVCKSLQWERLSVCLKVVGIPGNSALVLPEWVPRSPAAVTGVGSWWALEGQVWIQVGVCDLGRSGKSFGGGRLSFPKAGLMSSGIQRDERALLAAFPVSDTKDVRYGKAQAGWVFWGRKGWH